MIKILHLRSSGGLYGAEMVILNAARELNRMGCDNHVVCINNLHNPHAELVDEAPRYGVEASAVDAIGLLDWEAIKQIREKLAGGGFNVLHCHDYKASMYGLLASFGLKIRRVVTNHLWDKINLKLWLYQRLEGVLYNFFDAIVAVSEEVKRDIRPFIVRKSKIEVISNGIDVSRFGQTTDHRPQTEEKSPQSVVDSLQSKKELRNRFGLTDHDFVIGIVGRLARQKGHAYLLRAFAQLLTESGERRAENGGKMQSTQDRPLSVIRPQLSLKLLIVGDGPLEKSLKNLCGELSLSFTDLDDFDREIIRDRHQLLNGEGLNNWCLSRIIFAGVQTDMPAVYRALDLLVMPSLEEGLPMVLLEAMAGGVPVVATPVGEIPAIIKDGETGFLVEPGRVDELAEVLKNIIDTCRVRPLGEPLVSGASGGRALQDIATSARNLVQEKYSASAMAKKYLEIYEWLLE